MLALRPSLADTAALIQSETASSNAAVFIVLKGSSQYTHPAGRFYPQICLHRYAGRHRLRTDWLQRQPTQRKTEKPQRNPVLAKLYFYYSAMNAGKTTTLLQSSFNYQERGMGTMLFTAAIDDRKGVGKISSRIGLEANAHLFGPLVDMRQTIEKEMQKRAVDCVLIDEAQFLTKDHVFQLASVADELGIPVLCYGLRSDFQANLFEGSKWLLAIADILYELKTICTCGSKATMNLRIDANGKAVKEGASIEIGGNDRYIALCRKHFMEKLAQR